MIRALRGCSDVVSEAERTTSNGEETLLLARVQCPVDNSTVELVELERGREL